MSKKKIKIIIYIGLNNFGFTEDRFTKEWIDTRIGIFMNFTLKSLKIQTNQDFLALVRYHEDTADIVKNVIYQYEELPPNIRFVDGKEFAKAIIDNIIGYDYLYLVRLDSDDLYHKTYIQQLHEYTPKEDTKVLINQNGYLYDSVNNRIAEYYHFSPQFYTLIYKVDNYLKGERIKSPGGGHGNMIKLPYEIINERNYINHVHFQNASLNSFRLLNNRSLNSMGNIIDDKDEVEKIVKDFM